MAAKPEPRVITFTDRKKLYRQTNAYDDGVLHKFLCWDVDTGRVDKKSKAKIKDVYGIRENEFKDYFANPSTHSVNVWAMLKGSADFIATVRNFADGVSYVYDVDKKILGVVFHDDVGYVWSI